MRHASGSPYPYRRGGWGVSLRSANPLSRPQIPFRKE